MVHLGCQWDFFSEYTVCKFTRSQSPHYTPILHENELIVLQKNIKNLIDMKVEKK